ncbi:MAG TPA: MlaD family protein [Candidatus Acidoferrales bacterium]|nr:MlaD family protein [Candidatus Acidoferrales bacterium]
MAQRKQLSWSELRVGIFVVVGIAIVMIAIIYVTGTAGALAHKYTLVTYLPEVEGVTKGAPVSLDGIAVGNVDDVSVNPQSGSGDPNRSIKLVLRVQTKYQNDIRTCGALKPPACTESTASLVTEGLLGNRYVNISRGYNGTPLQANAEVPGEEEKAMKQIVERGAELAENLNALTQQISDIVADVNHGKGTLGKFLNDDSIYNHFDSVSAKLDTMMSNIQAGQGTLGQLYVSRDMYDKFNGAVGRADDLLAAVQQQKGTFGKLIYDPALHDQAMGFIQRGDSILDDVKSGKGTAGKLVTDDTLFATWKQAGTNLSDATGKLNNDNGSLGRFLSDPKLYDNLAGLTGDMRLLMNDFRKDPKKFLRVRFSIF